VTDRLYSRHRADTWGRKIYQTKLCAHRRNKPLASKPHHCDSCASLFCIYNLYYYLMCRCALTGGVLCKYIVYVNCIHCGLIVCSCTYWIQINCVENISIVIIVIFNNNKIVTIDADLIVRLVCWND